MNAMQFPDRYFVMKSKTYRECEGLLLDGLLQLYVVLVGYVQRQLQLCDVDLQLLLDASHLGLQLGLGLHNTSVQLLYLDAGLLAVNTSITCLMLL